MGLSGVPGGFGKMCACDGTGRHARFRFSCFGVGVRVPSGAPKLYNPNLFPIGDGFGLLVFFEGFERTHFKNGLERKATSKPRGPRKKK